MNGQSDKSNENEVFEKDVPAEQKQIRPGRRSAAPVVVATVASILLVSVAAWFFWPKPAGKPVAAPRSVSFEESQSIPTTGEQRLALTPEQMRTAALKIETVGEQPTSEAAGQMTTGTVQANSYKETPVVSLVGGIVRTVSAELGQNVRRGQRIAVVFSNELADAQSRYLTAVAVLDEHHRHHQRMIKLVEIGAASRQDLEAATSQYRESESTVANLRQKLLLLGMSAQRVDALNSTSQVSSEVSIPSPSSGTVTSRTVNPGEVIEANKELMRVTDLSTVWVVGQVYEKDLGRIHVGSGASIISDAYPGRLFRGQVSYVDPTLDAATRTAQVRIELANPEQALKIGMYVNVAFGAVGVAEKTSPTIPAAAVQNFNSQQIVFVATHDPNVFAKRLVRLGPATNGRYQVLEGLNVGDRIVTEGSFLLRAEWLKMNPTK